MSCTWKTVAKDCHLKVSYVKFGFYTRVFCSKFNVSFHHPNKDTCQKCGQYVSAIVEKKALTEE